jgi:RNA polymerase sigma-70 factor (ECF subfamily)
MTSDAELVGQARDGVCAARDELVRRWAGPVLAFCHATIGDRHAAEDVAQEALLRGMRSLDSLAAPERFGAWLRGIARRTWLDWKKSKHASQVPFTALASDDMSERLCVDGAATSDEQVGRADELRRLNELVDSLPERCREALMLYYYQNATYRDVAAALGLSVATVNARLSEARAILRRRITQATRRT